MQIIQGIRDKGAAIIIVVIALSLIGFILMDARQGSGSGFFGGSDNVAKINGKSFTQGDFNTKVAEAEEAEQARTGQPLDGARKNQLREQVWSQLVAETIFYEEAEKLGISISGAETKAILTSDDPANPFSQERGMIDPTSGKIDKAKAAEAYNKIRKMKGEERRRVDAQILEPLRLSNAVAKYGGMLSAASFYPTWMKQRDAREAAEFATISYVALPYSDISDSAVKVTDTDIKEYVGKHKQLFKQEAGRTISYALFSQSASKADSAAAMKQAEDLRGAFASDTNSKLFLARNTSSIDYKDNFVPRAAITTPGIDSILSAPQGSVYGPFFMNGSYALAKVIESKSFPDSVNARHILIGTVDPQSNQALMADSAAKKLADSLLVSLNGGADFAALAARYSTDPGSKDKGGLYEKVYYNQMVPEFNEFIFTKPVGSREVVKTQFGYHVLEVLKQGASKPAYKIAYLGKEVSAGNTTINEASLAATRASSQKDGKALENYLKPLGISMITTPRPIKENDFSAGELQNARELVRWAFTAKKGQVSEPFAVGDNYVVATVTNIYEEGTQDAETARSGAEAEIRKQKKADIIIKKIGDKPTLESAAAAYGKQIVMAGADSSLTFNAQIIPGLGPEYKLVGAAFNKDFQTKPSAPIRGTTAVFVMKTNSISNKGAEIPEALKAREDRTIAQIRNQSSNWFEALRKEADIKDNRSKFY